MKADISGKATLHAGKELNLAHNWRDYDKDLWNTDGHIDYGRTYLNEIETVAKSKQEFFDQLFAEDLKAFNDKNRENHPERCKSKRQYYEEHKGDMREAVVQLSNHKNYVELCRQVGTEKADELHKQFLHEVLDYWKSNYTTVDGQGLIVMSSSIHMDETVFGTPQIHIDFLPVAKSNRGLKTKVSFDGAFKAIGYKRNDKKREKPLYSQWLEQARLDIEKIADNYINLVPHEKSIEPHENPRDYNRRKAAERWAALERSDALMSEIKTTPAAFNKNKVTMSKQDFEMLFESVQAAMVEGQNQKEEDERLTKRKIALTQRESQLAQKERKVDDELEKQKTKTAVLDQQRRNLETAQKAAEREKAEAEEKKRLYQYLYDCQENLNYLYDSICEENQLNETDLIDSMRAVAWLVNNDENLPKSCQNALTTLINTMYDKHYSEEFYEKLDNPLSDEEIQKLLDPDRNNWGAGDDDTRYNGR